MIEGTSTPIGKPETKWFLLPKLQPGMKICDMGAGCGTYYDLLGADYEWTAVEIWHNSAKKLKEKYKYVYEMDICDFYYPEDYDLIIFGDVLEHLPADKAIKCVQDAKKHAHSIMIAIPYCYPQGPLYGNAAEEHLQVDLNEQVFDERYPDFERIYYHNYYAYYYWEK